uniref:Integrase catalytic domain-containing protein n=1 Tax=Fagus sylvatica TaxID=28930 RepID=A0A2N9FPW3_FAGSY
MAGETSGPGPSEQEIRMVALERKFDELLSFVQLIAKRNTEDENQRKEDDKIPMKENRRDIEAEPEGTPFQQGRQRHSTKAADATEARGERTPKLDSKIDSLEEKIRLIQGLNSFGNTDFSSMSWFPNMTVPPKFKAPEFEKYNGRGDPMIHLQMYCRKMAPYADNEPLLIQTFQDTLTGNAAEWYSQLKKISHWKELADTFLAQYGFNSQIAPDRFDLQRMEKKSNETFREYAQRWREKAARARPPLDEREMIKIFVDTLKNPYFDRMMGLQMQFFVDLIPVGDRIEDALKTKKIVDMTALMALAEQAAKKAPTKRKEGDVQMIGRNNGRPRQAPAPAPAPQMPARPEGNQPNDNRWLRKEPRQFTPLPMPMTELYPILIEKSLISPIVPKPYNGPQRRDFNPNSACDFHFGEVGHTVENCGQLRHRRKGTRRVSRGGVSFYTLEKQKHITPLDAPPGPSTGDSCEYHSGARGHSLDCCEEFKKKVTNLMENGIVGREEIPSKGSRQPDDPSEFDWYAEINLDDIVEDEMDLDNLQDEEADWGYFMEDDTDEWRDVDLTEFFQFPYLIMPPGFVTPEFEIFYEDGDPEVHLQKYGEKMALHLENELLMISVFPESLSKQTAAWFYQLRNLTGWDDLVRVFLERYRFNPHSILEYLGLKKDEEPYIIPDPGVGEVNCGDQRRTKRALSLPALTEGGEEEERVKAPPPKPHHHRLLLKKKTLALWITRKTSNDPHVSKIDNKTDCSLDNIDNSDEEIELPSDILEALERQDEGSKPNIEELEIVNLANEGEEPREVKIGTRCAAEQKEALIALLREFHEIFAWSYQDMPGLDTDIVVHKIPAEARMQARQTSTATDEARSHFEDQGRGGKAIEGRFPKHSNLFGLGSQYSPGAEEGRKTTNVVFSFMDGFSGYNQIKMAEEDKSKTAFVTHWGTFVYDVMPFGLKNAGATYQRAMVTLFHDMIHHEIEVYVDDMIAKSRTAQDHLTDLRKLFQRLKKYQLRLNPNKCAFGVTSGKLLGFIVSGRGIEIDPAKLTATCEPLFKLLRKDVKIKWTEDCQKAFDKIKEYLLNPPILVPPTPGRPLILYLTVQEASMGCMLGQQDETGKKEQAIYYLSKKFTEPETRYLLVEKTCCALAWASKKLRQYMLYYTTWLVSRMDPIKRSRDKAIADYLADYPSEQLELMDSEFPDEDVMIVEEDNQGRWKLYFDGAANAVGSGIGAVLVSPKGQQTPIAVKLGFDCTNNMTEYEACIVGLQAALEFGAYELEVFGDSLLIVSQTNGEWQASGSQAHPVSTIHQPANPKVQLVEGDDVRPLRIETRDIPAYCVCIEECMNVEAEIDDKPCFFLSGEILYKRTHDATLLRCVDAEEANRLIQEMHAGLMGAHANGPFLARKIMRAGYYWLTMERDCIRHVQTCHKCQMYQNSKNAPPQYLHTMASPWPFSAWGMDVIRTTSSAVTECQKMLITDNASNLNNRMMDQLCQQFKIQHHNSAPYRPKMNGAVEAANKNVKKILSKMTETYKDWHEHLPYALCAYRTSVRTSVGATPYSLVYGMEAVLPVEVEIPSLRILSQTQLEEAEWAQARYEQLNFIDEKRLAALCHGQLYQRRIERAYNKKARPRTFQPGDLVLKKRNMALSDPRGKFAPSYEGPYVVKKAFSGGAIILADMDGEEFRSPINSDSVIKYHV